MPKKIYIETYGCQMNEYESDRTYRVFHDQEGYEATAKPDDADLVLMNTCSIRDKADQKAFSSLGKLRILKLNRPQMFIAVGGCMAQSHGAEVLRRAPHVDLVFGTHQWAKLPELVHSVQQTQKQHIEIDFYGWKNYRFLPFRSTDSGAHPVSEFVTIQNGCDKFCSFCLVPFTRGREVSRPEDEIHNEVELLAAHGVKEVTLLGQNVNAYGTDRTGRTSFADLLKKLSTIDSLERLRFMTSHPAEMSPVLIQHMADNPKICEHLHLPVQSGSDRILEKMNRQYTVEDYRNLAARLRNTIPGLSLTTDLIVGFPGETEEDFEETLEIIRVIEFDDCFSFCYSPRPNTKASKLVDEFVDKDVASERLVRLQEVQTQINRQKMEKHLGHEAEVLVEGISKKQSNVISGKTRTNWTVNFEGSKDLVGTLVKVRLTEYPSHSFRGELLAPVC